MIARAAEGSVRDGLSLLDQAIAYGEGRVKAADVASMLGLMDRSRIIDLFETVMAGDAKAAIGEIEAQYQGGGDPATILSDLADYVHWVTRLKVVKEGALADTSRTEAEKTHGAEHAQKCGIAHLTRAWSMLLKGIRETELHSDPLMAAEMVLIRLCHAADLPGGEELARIVKQAQPSDRVVPMSARELLRGTCRCAGRIAGQPRGEAAGRDARRAHRDARLLELQGPAGDCHREARHQAEVRPRKPGPPDPRGARPVRDGPRARRASGPSRRDRPQARGLHRHALDGDGGQGWRRQAGVPPAPGEPSDSLFLTAREHPDVQAVLKRFPGAEIIDVKAPDASPTFPPT